MRHLRTVFCSLTLLVLVGIGSAVDSADTLPNAITKSWGEARKLCSPGPTSSFCEAIIDALSGKGNPISLPSSGDTLTDAINEAILQSGVQDLILSNSRDPDVVRSKGITMAMLICLKKDNVDNYEGLKAEMNVQSARIKLEPRRL